MDAPLPQTEAFGPLVTVHNFDDVDEAVAMANATQYGLAASVSPRRPQPRASPPSTCPTILPSHRLTILPPDRPTVFFSSNSASAQSLASHCHPINLTLIPTPSLVRFAHPPAPRPCLRASHTHPPPAPACVTTLAGVDRGPRPRANHRLALGRWHRVDQLLAPPSAAHAVWWRQGLGHRAGGWPALSRFLLRVVDHLHEARRSHAAAVSRSGPAASRRTCQ